MVCKLGFKQESGESFVGSITGGTIELYKRIHGESDGEFGLLRRIERDRSKWTGRFRGVSIKTKSPLENPSIIEEIVCEGYGLANRASAADGYLHRNCSGCQYNKED